VEILSTHVSLDTYAMRSDGSGLLDAVAKTLDRYYQSSGPLVLMTSAYAAAVAFLYRGLQVHDTVNTARSL